MLALLRPAQRFYVATLVRVIVAMLVVAFTVPAFGGACCSGMAPGARPESAAEAGEEDDCCADDAEHSDEDAPADPPCSCPFPCTSGCSGQLGRALAHVGGIDVTRRLVGEFEAPSFRELAAPTSPDPHDILHVPISGRV
jgi:hypothetical protein